MEGRILHSGVYHRVKRRSVFTDDAGEDSEREYYRLSLPQVDEHRCQSRWPAGMIRRREQSRIKFLREADIPMSAG